MGRTLLKKNHSQQRVLIAEYDALVSSSSLALLKSRKSVFDLLNSSLKLLDVLCPLLSESRSCLFTVLLSFLTRRIYLHAVSDRSVVEDESVSDTQAFVRFCVYLVAVQALAPPLHLPPAPVSTRSN